MSYTDDELRELLRALPAPPEPLVAAMRELPADAPHADAAHPEPEDAAEVEDAPWLDDTAADPSAEALDVFDADGDDPGWDPLG